MSDPTLGLENDGEMRVTAWRGSVLIDGLDGSALTLSPDIAEALCMAITKALRAARGQKVLAG